MITDQDRLIVGSVGGLWAWTMRTLARLAQQASGGPVPIVHLRHRHPVPDIEPGQPGRLLFCNGPTNEVADALADSTLPILYIHEAPSLSMSYLVKANAMPPLQAARRVAAAFAVAPELCRTPNLLMLDRGLTVPMSDLLVAVCQHLRLDIPPAYMAWLVRNQTVEGTTLAPLEASLQAGQPHAVTEPLPDPLQQAEIDDLCSLVLDPLEDIIQGRGMASIVWPGRIFNLYDAEAPNAHFGPHVALDGPAGILFHGPNICLPRGRYKVAFRFNCDDLAPDNTFRLIAHCPGVQLRQVRIKPRALRDFTGSFAFDHTDVGAPVQIQTRSDRGAIFGSLELVEIVLTRIEGPPGVVKPPPL